MSSADLPSQPPLSVEETGPAQEETSGLVSVCVFSSQCVTDVSSSAAPLDAMEKSSDVSVSSLSLPLLFYIFSSH